MSYADPGQPASPGAQPPRPTVVTVSTWMLWLIAALSALSAIATLANLGTISEVYEEMYEGTTAEGQTAIFDVVGVVISLLFAAAFVVLGIFNNRGKNASRITTWVIGGISLCCSGISLVLLGAVSSMEVEGGPDPAEVQERLSEQLPGWYEALNLLTSVVSILALIVALVLLALPAANEFFRKPPEEVFEPPPNYPPPNPPPSA